MEQIITEEWYKNMFRLLNSPRPEASMEIKKIRDDLIAMYEERGITEYFPPIPGDSPMPGGDTPGSEFVPISSRKFEKPVAPIRKDSLPADRGSPHLAAVRSNSPRLPGNSNDRVSSTTPKPAAISDDHHSDSSSDAVVVNISADSTEGSTSVATSNAAADGQLFSSITLPEETANKGLDDGRRNSTHATEHPKRRLDQRAKSDDSTTSSKDDEPPEKKQKVAQPAAASVPTKGQQKQESTVASPDFEGLACVVCKSFALLSPGNLIVECQGCRDMYHQKCHQPNVPKSQTEDPRLLWYCSQCEKKNRNRSDTSTATAKPTPNNGTGARRNTAVVVKDDKKQSTETTQPNAFRRSSTMESKDKAPAAPASAWISPSAAKANKDELLSKAASFLERQRKKAVPEPHPKPTTGNSSNPFAMALSQASTGTGTGLAKLATASSTSTTTSGLSKLAGSVHQQASTNTTKPGVGLSSISSTTTTTSGSSKQPAMSSSQQMQMAAEKRLQMMKKKAAMKGSFRL